MSDKNSTSNPETPNRHSHSPDTPQSWGQAGDLAREMPERMNGREGGGDSGGGAYPNPHTGKQASGKEGFFGHGGQTEMEYHGGSQLGEQDVGGNLNSAAKKAGPGKSKDS